MTTPVKEYSLNVIVPEETQRARPTVLVCVPVHHGPYDLIVRVRSGRYDSRDHRLRSRDLPSAMNDPPPASEWSEDFRTITMYPFKAWDGPVTEDPTTGDAESRQPPHQSGSGSRLETNNGTVGEINQADPMREAGNIKKEGDYTEDVAHTTPSLPSDDVDMVPGTPGEDDEAEEEWMVRSYRKSIARMGQEIVLR
ncbi:hypothetical protein NLI96_g11915 [Meripilus lineatus]|uniref:Uncharacterized protein n=1 Tax=Meripilus lineatus TaxID=2056292 RepID=A0AAD5UQV7_9APHY|nr:hypothetical protein NLI96_g11915 [Physisporinus lineatus]